MPKGRGGDYYCWALLDRFSHFNQFQCCKNPACFKLNAELASSAWLILGSSVVVVQIVVKLVFFYVPVMKLTKKFKINLRHFFSFFITVLLPLDMCDIFGGSAEAFVNKIAKIKVQTFICLKK